MSVSAEDRDAELVWQSRAGNQQAFGQIIGQYQCLICSLAYSATGNLSQSEDLAQETFLTAWKQIHKLREPRRLRSWLCGIARNLIHHSLRAQAREPVHGSESLEAANSAPAAELPPSDQAITREEQAILWRALERIPELYREPLVLFYREHQAIQRVAAALELSEDTVKQRLARGRKLLQAEVAVFVTGTLERTAPGQAFTLGVLAALPLLGATSATAATAGTVAKASLAAKAASVAGLAGAVLGPLLGLWGGVYGASVSIKNTRSPRERRFMIRQTWLCAVYVLLFLAAFLGLIFLGKPLRAASPLLYGCVQGLLMVFYSVGLIAWILKSNRQQHQIQIEEGTALPPVLQPRPARRSQELWNVYGGLGGGTAGALAWVVIQCVRTQEWALAAITILFGLALVLFGARACLRHPERRVGVLVWTVVLVGLFDVVVCLLHLHQWTDAS